MKLGYVASAVFGAAIALAASTASALTFDLENQPGPNNQTTLVFNDPSGLSLTITGFSDYVRGAGADTLGFISKASGGLGVDDNPQGTRLGAAEALVLTFSSKVSLTSLSIREVGQSDSFVSILDGDDNGIAGFDPLTVPNGANPQLFNVAGLPGFMGTRFVLEGQDLGNSGGGVRLAALSAVTAVPLPGTIGLLLAGVAGLAFVGRRRTAA